jgi:hypothetical protein
MERYINLFLISSSSDALPDGLSEKIGRWPPTQLNAEQISCRRQRNGVDRDAVQQEHDFENTGIFPNLSRNR